MSLPVLPKRLSLYGKRILMRVDWNVPLDTVVAEEDAVKLERTFPTIEMLSREGAIVILLTHLGRPKKREPQFSTRRLAHIAGALFGQEVLFLDDDLGTAAGRKSAAESVRASKPGTVFLCENVRFFKGEEDNSAVLAKNYAALADVYINNAFASCHRTHASISAVAKYLPSYAGPELLDEIKGVSMLLTKPKKPFVAVIGGAKLSTKIGIIDALLPRADKILIGGAMAHPFFAAKKWPIGLSRTEKDALPFAKRLLKSPKIVLPQDVVVVREDMSGPADITTPDALGPRDVIVDIGPETMREWARIIAKSKTLMWNGPLGYVEDKRFAQGSLVIAQAVATHARGPCYGVVGGGDTVPIAIRTGMSQWIDHVSTGGGAMLEFIAKKGSLPGIQALEKAKKK